MGHFGGNNDITGGNGITASTTGTLYQLMTGNGIGINSDTPNSGNNDFGVSSDGGVVNGFTYTEDGRTNVNVDIGRIFLPLNFWFCRNPGLALPLIALQYHEVKVKMTFETKKNLARTSTAGDFAAAADGDTNCTATDTNF